jgi:hypothetical protein
MQDVPAPNTGLAPVRRWSDLATWSLPPRWVVLIAIVVIGLGAVLLLLLDSRDIPPAPTAPALRNPVASLHAPPFITSPGSTDVLLVAMGVVLVLAVLAIGVFFFWLHSLPERLVHKSTKIHFDIVAALALLSLFTHVHLFWVAALLLALVKLPDFSLPLVSLSRMATSLEQIAESGSIRGDPNRDTRTSNSGTTQC